MKKAYKELVDFFENQEGWDKQEIISLMTEKTMEELNCVMPLQTRDPIAPDEVILYWGDDDPLPATLQDFAEVFFDKVIEGVCNAIRTA